MNLTELIHEIWKDERVQKLKIRKRDIGTIVKVTIDQIVKNLFKYGLVKLRGLFTVKLRKVKGRNIAHLQTKEIIKVDDYYRVAIKPSKRVERKLEEIRYKDYL